MVLGQDLTPRLFRDIWRERRAQFVADIGPAGAPSRLRAAAALSDCASILDVGCGPGVFRATLALADDRVKLERYVGVDPVGEMLPWRGPSNANPEAEFHETHAESLPFEDQAFHGVLLRHLLEHLEDPYPALREAARVCSRSLVLVFSQWPRDGAKSILTDAHLKVLRWSHGTPILMAELKRAGFAMVTVENFQPTPKGRARLVPRESIWICSRGNRSAEAAIRAIRESLTPADILKALNP